jgi:hypothetical protein
VVTSLAAAVLIALRVCRLRSSIPGSGADSNKRCLTRALTTLTLNMLSFLLLAAGSALMYVAVPPVTAYYSNLLVWNCFNCPVPSTVQVGAGFVCAAMALAGTFLSFWLDVFSHCCCRSNAKDGCFTNPNYWWVLPAPDALLANASTPKLAALKAAAAAGGGVSPGGREGKGGDSQAAAGEEGGGTGAGASVSAGEGQQLLGGGEGGQPVLEVGQQQQQQLEIEQGKEGSAALPPATLNW